MLPGINQFSHNDRVRFTVIIGFSEQTSCDTFDTLVRNGFFLFLFFVFKLIQTRVICGFNDY